MLLSSHVWLPAHGDLRLRDVQFVDPETQMLAPGQVWVRAGEIAWIWHGPLPHDVTAPRVRDGDPPLKLANTRRMRQMQTWAWLARR